MVEAADSFSRALFRNVEFRVDTWSLAQFKPMFADKLVITSWKHIDRVLFHCDYTLDDDWLLPLLDEFDMRQATPRAISFTESTKVSFRALTDLTKILKDHKSTLKTIVVPACYDGNIADISGAWADMLQVPWTFHSPRRRNLRDRNDDHNDYALTSTPESVYDAGHQPVVVEHTGCFNIVAELLKIGPGPLPVIDELVLLTHVMEPADLCRDILSGNRIYELSLLGQPHRDQPTLSPILFGFRHTPFLITRLHLSRIGLASYGQDLIFGIKRRYHHVLPGSSLKYLNINNCVGATVFFKGLKTKGVDLETLIFTETQGLTPIHNERLLDWEEENDVVDFVRSLRSLKKLSLNYTLQPSTASEEDRDVLEPIGVGVSGNHDESSSSGSSPELQQAPEVYCSFPLKRLLGPSLEYSLQSIALAQRQCKLSKADLIFLAEACPYVMDLAIPSPGIEKLVWPQKQITPSLQRQIEDIAVDCPAPHCCCSLMSIGNSQGVPCTRVPPTGRKFARAPA